MNGVSTRNAILNGNVFVFVRVPRESERLLMVNQLSLENMKGNTHTT